MPLTVLQNQPGRPTSLQLSLVLVDAVHLVVLSVDLFGVDRPLVSGPRLGGFMLPPAALGQSTPEGRGIEAIYERVQAAVQVPKHEETVVDILRCVLQNLWLKPVPHTQQIIRSPAHHKGQHYHHTHLHSLHPGFGDHVCPGATQTPFSSCSTNKEVRSARH